jgi:hypothetical protein
MVDTPLPVKKSASPNWWMNSRGPGTEVEPSTTFVLISGLDYLGKDRTTTTGAAEELTIPAGAKRAIISCSSNSQAHIEINGDASTSSPLYLEDPFGPLVLDLGGVTKLSAYVVAGNLGAVFFG